MTKAPLILLLFLSGFHFSGYSQITSDQLILNDSIWRYTHCDTFKGRDEFIINYYDSLALHYDHVEDCHAGQDVYDSNNQLRRKQRVLPNGFSYAIDYYNGIPIAGGYGNGSRTAYLQWHPNGILQFIQNYLLIEDNAEGGVKDGITILFDDQGNILRYTVYSNDVIVMDAKKPGFSE